MWLDAHEGFLARIEDLLAGHTVTAPAPVHLPAPAGPVPDALRRRLGVLAARWPRAQQDLAAALAAARPRRAYAARGGTSRWATPPGTGRDLRL